MKYTRAPWAWMITKHNPMGYPESEIIGESARIATINNRQPNWEGNARLVRAAPELLEFVEKFGYSKAEHFNSEQEHWEYIAALRIEALALIQKVKT